jgi:hypothetical protein
MNTLMSLSDWSDQFQWLILIYSKSSLIFFFFLGLFFQVMFIDSMFCSFIRIFLIRRHACLCSAKNGIKV